MDVQTDKEKLFYKTIQQAHEQRQLSTTTENLEEFKEAQLKLLEASRRKLRPSPDMLGVERLSWIKCKVKCEGYEPFEVFLLERNEMSYSECFTPSLCRNCQWPAYFHPPISKPLIFPPTLLDSVRNYQMTEDNINFHGVLVIFEIDYNFLDSPTCRTTLKNEEDDLFLLLQQGGFQVICRAVRVLGSEEARELQKPSPALNVGAGLLKNKISSNNLQVEGLYSARGNPDLADKMQQPNLVLWLSSTSYRDAQSHFQQYIKAVSKLIPRTFSVLYSSKNSTQGFSDCLESFPEVFNLKQTFVLLMPDLSHLEDEPEFDDDPMTAFFRRQSQKLKGMKVRDENKDVNELNIGRTVDMLNYNGYNIAGQSDKTIENEFEIIPIFKKIMNDRRANDFVRLLLSGQKNMDLHAIVGSKIGIQITLSTNPFNFDTFSFTSENDVHQLASYFFPELANTQRTCVIFRPIVVRSGLNRVFLQVFKANQFNVVATKFKVLTLSEAAMLSKEHNLDEVNAQRYLDMMITGESQIVILSKFGAVHEAKTICDGSKHGRRRIEKSEIGGKTLETVHVKQQLNPYKIMLDEEEGTTELENPYVTQQLVQYPSDGVNSLFTLNPFTSLSEMIDLEVLVGVFMESQEFMSDQPKLYRRRKAIEELREFKRKFNISAYSSADEKSATEDIEYFFPQLFVVNDIMVKVKPEYEDSPLEFEALIQKMKFCIVASDRVRIAEQYSGQDSARTNLDTLTSENSVLVYHLSKQGCRQEVQAMFSRPVVSRTTPLMPHHMSYITTIVQKEDEFESMFKELSFHTSVFSGEIITNLKQLQILEILDYCLRSTTGTCLKHVEKTERLYDPPFYLLSDDPEETHVTYVVTNEYNQQYEVKIRRYFKHESNKEEKMALVHDYVLTGWFYRVMLTYTSHGFPDFQNYKVEPEKSSLPLNRVFSVEKHIGEYFLDAVAYDLKANRHLEINRKTYVSFSNVRLSASAYLWGRKLANLAKKFKNMPGKEIEDFGPLYWNGSNVLGAMDQANFFNLENQKYIKCLEDLKKGWTDYIGVEKCVGIEERLRVILKSEAFFKSRRSENICLMPENIGIHNLRTYVRKVTGDDIFEDEEMQIYAGLFSTRSTEQKEVTRKEIGVVDTLPGKYPYAHIGANILWLFKLYLKKLDRKIKLVEGDAEEYDVLLESVIEGFVKNFDPEKNEDREVDGISLFRMEFFLFSFWQAWKTVLTIINLENKRKEAVRERDAAARIANDYTGAAERAGEELKSIQEEMERWDYELTHQLEALATINLSYEPGEGLDSNTVGIHHLRYFKHWMLDAYEENKDHPRYIDRDIQRNFPTIPQAEHAQFTNGLKIDEATKRLLNPQKHVATALRDIPEKAYRDVERRVRGPKWMVHERQKKLVEAAILGLFNFSKLVQLNKAREASKQSVFIQNASNTQSSFGITQHENQGEGNRLGDRKHNTLYPMKSSQQGSPQRSQMQSSTYNR